MSYEFYKVLHITAVLFAISSLGAAALLGDRGAPRGSSERKAITLVHGISLSVALIAGFGLLARLGLMAGGMPAWVIGKLVIWLVLGGAIALAFRKPGKIWFYVFPIIAAIAAFLAVYKPGS